MDLDEALALADGSSQPWNEVYQHPKACSSRPDYEKRFRLAQKIESRLVALLRSGKLSSPLPHDCGLNPGLLEKYTVACGLDVDLGVGSLILSLNELQGVTTLSSCNSIHVGAHEEEALVAFTASSASVESLRRCLGKHFRESRDDVVKPLKAGQKAHAFSSFIVLASAPPLCYKFA